MYGLMVLIAIAVYLGLCALLIMFVVRKTTRWRWAWGLLAAVVYNAPLFYLLAPQHIAQSYLCTREANLQVFTTFDQWQAKYPAALEALEPYESRKTDYFDLEGNPVRSPDRYQGIRVSHVSERLDRVLEIEPISARLLRETKLLVDRKTNLVLARRTDLLTLNYPLFGGRRYFGKGCYPGNDEVWRKQGQSFRDIEQEFRLQSR